MTATDDHVLITGASSGIGRDIAVRMSKTHSVVLHGRDQSRLEATLALCNEGKHRLWQFDLADVAGIKASLGSVVGPDGVRISKFVHSAGVAHVSSARLLKADAALHSLNVNALSAMEIVSLLLRKPINDGRLRSVVFLSSIWGHFGAAGHVAYSASKGALDAAMRTYAVELAPLVRFNSIALGAVDTPMAQASLADAGIHAKLERAYPLGLGEPSDAAAACAFLLSDEARWITGQVMFVDGGRTAQMSSNSQQQE